ncbi:hypothetical protein CHELA40_12569 [Chelatococcus asaccharovorans]|nr:hypothetical protein CHELA40_12569 [Chelatococcus asaccharovorans]CAH1682290.1 hypothetical protein CHELA17_63045 [Chelatococcus asaccharovorans]
MGDGSFLAQGQSNCEWSREADHCEHEIGLGEIASKSTVLFSASNDDLHECAGSSVKIGPITFVEERMDHIDHTNPVIERGVHVLTKSVYTVRCVFDKCLSSTDAPFQCVASDSMEERLLIREVSVESSDADPGAFCDGIARGFAAHFQY